MSCRGTMESSQWAWDDVSSSRCYDDLISRSNQVDKARLLAASAPNSGAWLQAIPLPDLGLHLDNEAVRVSVALRLGALTHAGVVQWSTGWATTGCSAATALSVFPVTLT